MIHRFTATPNPPLRIGKHLVFIFTVGSSNLSLHLLKKFLRELSYLLATTMAIVNKEMKSVGKLESVHLVMSIFPF